MPTSTYERYGLTGNPFRDLAAENVEDVAIFHVNQEIDENLRTIREEVYDKENRAVVAITGAMGAGKTERLLLAAAEGRERGAFTVYFDLTNRVEWVLKGLATEIRKSAEEAKISKAFSSPAWLRGISSLEKSKEERYDPKAAGKAIAAPFNEQSPALLLFNDLHNLVEKREVDSFAEVLQETVDALKPGVLVMFAAFPSYIAWLKVNHPAFASRINRTFQLPTLSDEEAALILAKKMLAKRVVEDLDPTFPFDAEAVRELNRAAGGNPRHLLEKADMAIEYGVAHRSYHVDVDVVRAALNRPPPSPEVSPLSAAQSSPSGPSPSPPHSTPVGKSSGGKATAPTWSESKLS